MRLLAPAKINLHLRVAPLVTEATLEMSRVTPPLAQWSTQWSTQWPATQPTAVGFHPLCSWMCTVGLFDTLLVQSFASAGSVSGTGSVWRFGDVSGAVALRCDDPTIPCDQTNLVVRAADAMFQTVGEDGLASIDVPSRSLSIVLHKRVPAGGGLGGGSSDAARIVLGLDRLWNLRWPAQRLSDVAATLGSDVAFFCHGSSSVCTGRGQIVRPIDRPAPGWAVLILPPIAVPTGPVYRRFDELLSTDDREASIAAVEHEPDWRMWTKLDALAVLPKLVNDLERPAFDLHPALAHVRADIEQTLGRIVRMSGSGSSLFTLYDDRSAAERAAETVTATHGIRATAVPLAPQIEDDLS